MEETKKCPFCGEEININAKKCKYCGEWLTEGQINTRPTRKGNGIGIAGFVLSLISLLFCWIPIFNFIIWVLGFIFSFIGLFRKPRGLAITGFLISIIGLIVLILIFAVFESAITDYL